MDNAKQELKYTCLLLWKEIEALRKGIGKEETLLSTLERLRANAVDYAARKKVEEKGKGYDLDE